jgi:type II restriction enzyme
MAKRIAFGLINSASDLVTSREKTRAGFITLALEKNYLAVPYVDEAKALRAMAGRARSPMDLLNATDLRAALLAASGLSDKSLKFLTEDDKLLAIKGLIEKFLEPAGDGFRDELVYRYLLTKGDALGGKARNLAGTLGERKFLRSMVSVFNLSGLDYRWNDSEADAWLAKPDDDAGIETRLKGLCWAKDDKQRLLLINIGVPAVGNNVDLSILNGTVEDLKRGRESIIYDSSRYVALGELKGGIDPAGADEHWKTANSAIQRIRNNFRELGLRPQIFFIGAAIENSMGAEIFKQLQSGEMNNAANLTNDEQLTAICEWIINL